MTKDICHAFIVLCTLLLPWAGTTAQAGPEDQVALTWKRAELWLAPRRGPFAGGLFRGRLSDVEMQNILGRLPADDPLPTVLFMHGCAHTKHGAWTYARRLALAGYAVIIPDSFARAGRPKICNKWNREPLSGAPAEVVHRMRLEELRHAVAMVPRLPWADQRNLFLMGHEDGADAVATGPGTGFRAVVLSAASCRWGWGLRTDTPVMVMASDRDPVPPHSPVGACVNQAVAQGNIEARVIPGGLHDLSGHPAARRAMLSFFGRAQAQ